MDVKECFLPLRQRYWLFSDMELQYAAIPPSGTNLRQPIEFHQLDQVTLDHLQVFHPSNYIRPAQTTQGEGAGVLCNRTHLSRDCAAMIATDGAGMSQAYLLNKTKLCHQVARDPGLAQRRRGILLTHGTLVLSGLLVTSCCQVCLRERLLEVSLGQDVQAARGAWQWSRR